MQATPLPTIAAPELSLRVNLAWMLIGNLIQAGAQWGIVVVLARLGSPASVGTYALALAVISPVFLFSNMHLRALLATDVGRQTGAGAYFSLRIATSASATLLLLAGAFYLGSKEGLIFAGLTAAKAFESISEVLYGEMQRTEQMNQIGKSMVVRWGGSLVVVATILSSTHSLLASLAGMTVVSAVVAVWDLSTTHTRLGNSSLPEMKQLAVAAAPLGFLMLMVSLNAAIPRYYLAAMHSQHAVGIYAALSYVSIGLNTLIMAAGQAGGTAMARSYWARDGSLFISQAARLVSSAVALGAAGVFLALWKGEELLELLYGPTFAAEGKAFVWLMVAGALSYVASALGYALASARCFHPQLPSLILTSLATAVCCHLLVPQSGIAGAAKAQIAGYALQSALSVFLLGYSSARRFR